MKLNLGAGNDIQKGYINHDIRKHRSEIDIAFDLNDADWEISLSEHFDDYLIQHPSVGYFQEIRAWDVLEHLNDPINFFNNCWDLLKADGVLDLKVCGYENESFHIDLTHKKGYHVRSFDYLVPDTPLGKEYGYYTDKRWSFVEWPRYDRKGNVLVKLTPIK